MTHLILHKVRGEAAFDIAEQIRIGDEEGWIIPTSGHRAYPFKSWPLAQIINMEVANGFPPDWPDHYPNDVGEPSQANIMAYLSNLFPKVKRRL